MGLQLRTGVPAALKIGLLAGLASSGMTAGAGKIVAQGTLEAGLRQHSIDAGEAGSAWLEEVFGGLLAIESIQIQPPDTVFDGRDQHLLVRLLESGGKWTTVIDLPVNPTAARDPAVWPRISLAPEITPEMAAIYEMTKRTPPSPESFGYRLAAEWRPPQPLLAEGVRFELVGPAAMGTGWTLWVRTDTFAASVGGVSREWKYVHVW